MRDDPRDDFTPTDREAIDALAAQLESFRKDPSELDLFRELKRSLKKGERFVELAELLELRAPCEGDPQNVARCWFEAATIRSELGDIAAMQDALALALDSEPGHENAARKLVESFQEQGRFAEAADILETEITAIESRNANGDAALARRLASRHRAAARMWQEHLGRLDKALHHWQRAFQLEPQDTTALEESRAIYASLGDETMVATLYETELEVLGDRNRQRRAQIELALGRLKSRRSDTESAARHLESALELDPSSDDARESLAEVYAASSGETDQQRAGELFVDLGRQRMKTEDSEAAINYLRRALGVDPYSRTGTDNLEQVLRTARRYDELDRLYQHRIRLAETAEEKASLLTRRAELLEKHLDDAEALRECLEELATIQPPGNAFSRRLRTLYEEEGDARELVKLLEADIASKGHAMEAVGPLLELASIYREQLDDRDRAAECLHRVLTIDALNNDALTRYSDHFRERRDWRGLTDLNEYIIDQLRERGSSRGEIVRRLEEVAELSELRLGDIERAISTWRRIEELEGPSERANEALRRLMSRAKMWESLVGVLEQEAQSAQSPHARAEALRRIAQVYRERQVNPRRAIALYEEILTLFPQDDASLKALTELYEREGDDAGLAHTIRRQLELELQRMLSESGVRPNTAREWPVARRVERLTALRRLASMYEKRLADVEGVVYACSGILEILPGDRDALERMERVLEKAGDTERLEQTLEYHVASSTAPAERARLLRKLAQLAAERADEVAAMERWELVLRAAPTDPESHEELASLYARHERWPELAEVLERSLMNRTLPEAGSPEAAKLAAKLKQLAQVLDQRLTDPGRAIRAWRRVLEISSKDRDALAALSRLYEAHLQWRDLAEILDRQVPLYSDDEPEKAAEIALRRAELLEQHLGATDEATRTLEDLIRNVSPRNLDAHRKLRRLYETRGAFEPAIRVAEREMYLTDDRQAKIARGLEIGVLCRDRLGDPQRALQAFERILSLDPSHEEAMAAASDLYAKVGDWPKHVRMLERRIELQSDERSKRALMLRVATAEAERLGDHRTAFSWYRRAHELLPDATTISELRRAAESYGLWRDLSDVYEAERKRLRGEHGLQDKITYVATCRELAAIAEHRLKDSKAAIEALHAALEIMPDAEDILAEAERIAQEANRKELWKRLLSCFDLAMKVASRDTRVALCLRCARIYEDRLTDHKGAMEQLLRAFSWAPLRGDVRAALYELGERSGLWSEVLTIETALAERAPNVGRQVEILRRKALCLEENASDLVRAFRVHLSAFMLAPEDDETIAHLWRLARAIGTYQDGQKTPEPEPAPAFIEPEALLPQRGQTQITIAAKKPQRESTQEISISDLVAPSDEDPVTIDDELPATKQRSDRTQPLELSDLIDIRKRSVPEPTMELRTEDLIEALGIKKRQPPVPPQKVQQRKALNGPPPPPPRRPEIKKQPPGLSVPAKRATPGKAQRAQLPSSPSRPYSSPWSELAHVYSTLPASNLETRQRWHFRAAEVWETGAADIPRAFEALATALDLEPDNHATRDRLFRLASAHGEWDRLAALYERAAEEANSADAAAELLIEVAAIRSEQGRPHETESLYRRVLGMKPNDAAAREKLEELYRKEERWIDLAAQLEERTDPRLRSAAPAAERPALLLELATLYRERLSRPHDAIEALERLLELEPESLELLQHIASLFENLGRWHKVISTLNRVVDAADGQDEARLALRRIGAIYEEKLELPDRAIEAYSTLLAEWPQDQEAFAALDLLYQQHGRWRELEDILRRRAAVVREPDERATLLHRRAKILLEWLESPEEAAAALRHARTIRPDDSVLTSDLVTALSQANRDREAAAVLEGRIGALRAAGGAAGEIAALLIKLASLRGEKLRDPHGARAVLEEALTLVPDHPTALATLARLAEVQKDPRAYAEARLREADALSDVDAKAEALFAAGKSLRDSGDIPGARAALERILELQPFHAEATWALSALVERAGDVDEAIRLLSARLEAASLSDQERAQVATQLAALSRQAGVEAVAERRLHEALAVVPDHLPAVFGLADLLAENERWVELDAFLDGMLPALEDKTAETRSELLRRRALTYEALDRADDAYQTLNEADRLHRGNLLVKLALGQNRYRARRWREAALHLGSLADHPDASQHPAKVAAGLYHAALAEIRSLRPEKAEGLYERALALKNNYAPALHALAEIAMEKGDVTKAADLLTRQAMATDSPAERLKLFEALGDMAVLQLEDSERARTCYEAAVNAASPLESEHIPLLQKLLERQDESGDQAGSGRTCEFMASFVEDAARRSEWHVRAARHFLAAEAPDRARGAADRAVAASPYDLVACEIASQCAMADKDFEATAAMLGRALNSAAPPATDDESSLQALLWCRLADARTARGDQKGALGCYEKALEVDAKSDGAMGARRALLKVWSDDPAKAKTLLEFRRVLAAHTLNREDVVDYARALCKAGHGDGGRSTLELAAALGHDYSKEDVAFLARHGSHVMAEDESYKASIDSQIREALICDADEQPLATLSQILWEAAPLLWTDVEAAFARSAIARAERIASTSDVPAAAVFTRIARALDAPATVLYANRDERAPDVQVVCVSPPIVVIGRRLLGQERPPDLELRYLLARAAEYARPERILGAGLPRDEFLRLLGSLVRLFGSGSQMAEAQGHDANVHQSDELLRKTLPVKTRARIEDLLADHVALRPEAFLAACARAADRAGFLICGDLDTVRRVKGDGSSDDLRHLWAMVLRKDYLTTRARLGIGAKKSKK